MPSDKNDKEKWYPEDTLLEGEHLVPPIRFGVLIFSRVAVSFAFMSRGQIVALDSQTIRNNFYGLELLAVVGKFNNKGPQSMFARAVWFGEGVPWKWMRIDSISNIIMYHTKITFSFRSGLVD
ncbi:hypothetical protein RSAG8_08796, partial [Rhizoctonia solani AG-8 WAC10335]